MYNAYCAWRRVCKSNGSSEYQFCRKNFLSPQTLSNIEDLKAQLTATLVDAGFLSLDEEEKAVLNRYTLNYMSILWLYLTLVVLDSTRDSATL